MHTFLTVTATGTKFALSVFGKNHGDAFKHANNVANGCTVKHETHKPMNENLGRELAYWAMKTGFNKAA